MKTLEVLRPGRVEYGRAWEWQKELAAARAEGQIVWGAKREVVELSAILLGGKPQPSTAAFAGFAGESLQFQQRAEREAEHARAADAKQVAPSHFEMRIAEVGTGAASYFNHKIIPLFTFEERGW